MRVRSRQDKSEKFKILLDKIFLLSLVVPIIPVVIPLAVDLSDAVSGDLVVRVPTPQIQGL